MYTEQTRSGQWHVCECVHVCVCVSQACPAGLTGEDEDEGEDEGEYEAH